MSMYLGDYPVGSTIYVPFATYDKDDGSSITMTGLAVTDIEIYKNGSATQRASDAGYTLLDTDGIDFDGITGIHGFSIDTADNTTAGFFTAGADYWVVVSSITVDAVTINFVAGVFSIENRRCAGELVRTTIATLASQTSFTLTAGSADNNAYVGCTAVVSDIASAIQKAVGYISAYTGSTKTITLAADPAIFTMAAGDNITILAGANVKAIGSTVQTARDIGASVLLSSGTGTGQLDITSGVTKANVTQCAGGAVPAGAIPNAVAGAAGGLFIAGTNAATTITTSGGSALTLSSTGANGSGLAVSGNGTGHGVIATGGATGNGLRTLGGATSGAGIYAASQAGTGPTSYAIYATGNATGADTGGMFLTGGATGGDGLECLGTGNGHGFFITGAGTGDGIHATSGSGNGAHGMHCQAVGSGVSHGLMLQGNTGGDDLFLNGNDAPTLNSVIWGSTTVRALTSGGLAPITAWTVAITGNVTGNLTGSVGSVATGGIASTSFATGAITADSIAADAIGASELAADATNEIADAILARNVSGGSSTGRTVKQALHVLRNKVAISAGTMTVYDTDDASSSWTAAVTGTAGADPVTTVDPA